MVAFVVVVGAFLANEIDKRIGPVTVAAVAHRVVAKVGKKTGSSFKQERFLNDFCYTALYVPRLLLPPLLRLRNCQNMSGKREKRERRVRERGESGREESQGERRVRERGEEGREENGEEGRERRERRMEREIAI